MLAAQPSLFKFHHNSYFINKNGCFMNNPNMRMIVFIEMEMYVCMKPA